MQNTIAREIRLEGIGLHSGKKVALFFKPSGPGEGIVFKRVDVTPQQVVRIADFEFGTQKRRTTVTKDGVEIHTVEHLMAALWALRIDNIMIEIDNAELPGLDGSGKGFYDCLAAAGVSELDRQERVVTITRPLWCEHNDAFIGIFPSESGVFRVGYMLEAPVPSIGRQFLDLVLTGDNFSREIIGARTFCLRQEAEMLLKMGYGKGANTANTLVMDESGPIDNTLRFPDEPVRHKILDLVGDLYLTGAFLKGRVIAVKSGHELNMALVEKIRAETRSST
ncbi:MAG: UDP-3-O-acyl-N-acetylglucosamine deacetylase [Candidatus Omnitrophica bacterium]|nr:UDP-3-O-acyl-N-acetylglucosamine deacetylase [Candidatus Omnitrophota bacterium]